MSWPACSSRVPRIKFRGTVTRSETAATILLCSSAACIACGHSSCVRATMDSRITWQGETLQKKRIMGHRGPKPQPKHLLCVCWHALGGGLLFRSQMRSFLFHPQTHLLTRSNRGHRHTQGTPTMTTRGDKALGPLGNHSTECTLH